MEDNLAKTEQEASLPKVVIREAQLHDIDQLATLMHTNSLDLYVNDQTGLGREDLPLLPLERVKQDLAMTLQSSGYRYYVGETNGELSGYVVASKTGAQHEIQQLHVIPTLQRQGLGTQLLGKALDWLGGNEDIHAKVEVHNYHTIELNKRFGFKETSVESIRLNTGKMLQHMIMTRPKGITDNT